MMDSDRILDGLARTLEEAVLPALESGFARGQLFAVLEVLGGLEGQLEWGGMLLENEAGALAGLIELAGATTGGELGERLRSHASAANAPLAERLNEGRALVCALIEAGHADEEPIASAIDTWLANDTIFKAMALRPGRLGEISQG
ncbi:MAG: hypothetical protein ABR587_15700 [Candidatus Binatia bacterium]